MTPTEYLASEERSNVKHEYLRGEVRAMAGVGPMHNLVCANVVGELGTRLRSRRCVVLPCSQSVYVAASELATYPDVTVLCEAGQYHPDFPQSLTNPSILVEILSVPTEGYDRGAKFDHYGQLESLREYVLVATDRFAVDHYLREANGTWRLTFVRGLDASLRLPSVDIAIPLAAVYAKIELVVPQGDGPPLAALPGAP